MLITFEGLDYSGKSTQAKLLVDQLRKFGKEVILLREPGGTTISEKIRDILLDMQHLELTQRAELFLFSAARTQLVTDVIIPALKRGVYVVCDRFYDSTTAYQGFGRNLNIDDVQSINRIATFETKPDLTFFVDIPIDEIFFRQKAAGLASDRMEFSGCHFFEKVRQGYLSIAKTETDRFFVIDGMRRIELIHEEIWSLVQKRII